MKAVCYARVSTLGQVEGYSLQTQKEETDNLARALGADEIIYVEDAYTGTELNRPAMNKLREMIRDNECDLVVAYDPDRIARDLTDLLIVTREIDKAGVPLRFVNFEWENTPAGRMFLQMRGAIAEFEHALILERTTRGKTKKASTGKLRTAAQPYGYRFDKVTDSLVVQEDEAEWVLRIFAWFIDEGLSTWNIAKRLAELGVPGPKSPNWSHSQVWRILKSRTYTGVLVRKDERPEWEPVRVPAIIDVATWEKAQTLIARSKAMNPKATKGEFLVQRLAVCGGCGRRLVVYTSTSRKLNRSWHYYTCPGRHPVKFGPTASPLCTVKPIRTEELDRTVWERVSAILKEPRSYVDELRQLENSNKEPLRVRLEEAKTRLQRAIDAEGRVHKAFIELGSLDELEYRKYLGEYRTRAADAEREIEALQKALRLEADLKGAEETLTLLGLRLQRAAMEGEIPFEVRQRLVRELVEKILVTNDVVEIRGAFDSVTEQPTDFMPLVADIEKRAVTRLAREELR